MSHAATAPKPNRTRLIIIVVAIVVVIGLLVFALTRGSGDKAEPSPEPTTLVTQQEELPKPPSEAATSAPAAASPTASANPAAANCTAVGEGFVPNRFSIERFGVDEPIVALNLDKDGNIAAPPLDEPRMASWWSGGPQPGADKGKSILSIHTYRTGKALGNEMFADGKSQFQPGDIIKLYGDAGQVKCFQYTGAEKIFIDDYDPDSTVMVDFEGDPSLTIIICWDFESSTEVWESRVFFNFEPVQVS